MLFLNFGDNVLGRYTLRLRISRIINISLFSKIFLKSLGLFLFLFLCFSSSFDNIEHSYNAFNLLFKEVLDEHTPKKKVEITEPTKPVYYGQGKRTYENKGVFAEVSEKNRRSRRLDEIQES